MHSASPTSSALPASTLARLRDKAGHGDHAGDHAGDRAGRGDRGAQSTLAEVFSDTAADAAAVGFALAHLRPGRGPVLWLQDRQSRRETGRPYLAGMGVMPDLLYLELNRPADVLWAMEEGLRCPLLGGVVAEVWGNPVALDFTATKRLALRSEAHDVPAWLIRRAATPDLSAARERWRVASLPSALMPDDMRAPGAPLWRVDLFRARWRSPGQWVARYDKGALVMEHGMQTADQEPQPLQAQG